MTVWHACVPVLMRVRIRVTRRAGSVTLCRSHANAYIRAGAENVPNQQIQGWCVLRCMLCGVTVVAGHGIEAGSRSARGMWPRSCTANEWRRCHASLNHFILFLINNFNLNEHVQHAHRGT